MPVLAEQAIKGASLIENGQIFVAILSSLSVGKLGITSPGSTGADPISHAVSRQSIIIPTDVAFVGGSPRQPIFPVDAQSAIAHLSRCETTLVSTDMAPASLFSLRRPMR